MIFLKYNVDEDSGDRLSRWYAAHEGDDLIMLPLVMVDSGLKISNGWIDFYPVYKDMVETALARPPEADIVAHWWRSGDRVEVVARLTNLQAETLSPYDNGVTLFAVVYEENPTQPTNRFVRVVGSTQGIELVANETGTYRVTVFDTAGVDWSRAHVAVLLDFFRSDANRHVMAQAAVAEAVAPELTAVPEALTFLVDPADTVVPGRDVVVWGGGFVNWTAAGDRPWLHVAPDHGQLGDSAWVSIDKSGLAPGWQEGTITLIDKSSN